MIVVAVAKVFLIDLARLDRVYRMLSVIGLGLPTAVSVVAPAFDAKPVKLTGLPRPSTVVASVPEARGGSTGPDGAGMVGVILVLLIMIAYYRIAGMLAVGALAIYILIVLGGLALFDATLTVPGIAGLVLSIGMAVDANILIYERIREEIRRGKELLQPFHAGRRRAMPAGKRRQ